MCPNLSALRSSSVLKVARTVLVLLLSLPLKYLNWIWFVFRSIEKPKCDKHRSMFGFFLLFSSCCVKIATTLPPYRLSISAAQTNLNHPGKKHIPIDRASKDRKRHWGPQCSASSCSALLCCLFHTTIEYLYSTLSPQLKYFSARFNCLKDVQDRTMFVRLSLLLKYLNMKRALWFWNFKSLKITLFDYMVGGVCSVFLAAPKTIAEKAMYCCFVSTAQIFEYVRYLHFAQLQEPPINPGKFLCSAVSK